MYNYISLHSYVLTTVIFHCMYMFLLLTFVRVCFLVVTAIPALQPIVYDLFLLRGTSRSDVSKELETQREVVVSMLLRLIHYHQVCARSGWLCCGWCDVCVCTPCFVVCVCVCAYLQYMHVCR